MQGVVSKALSTAAAVPVLVAGLAFSDAVHATSVTEFLQLSPHAKRDLIIHATSPALGREAQRNSWRAECMAGAFSRGDAMQNVVQVATAFDHQNRHLSGKTDINNVISYVYAHVGKYCDDAANVLALR